MIAINRVKECDTCDGFCCKYFIMPLKLHPKIKDDYIKWLELHHGVKVIYHKGKDIVKIPIKCKYLLSDGKCKIFNTEERPKMCNAGGCPKEDEHYISKL